ncbi:MAG: hypothetical protein ACREGA_03180 [Candidatus Saccharimonadales bacterium]
MGFQQYHEPAHDLDKKTRTRARMFASLTEEAEAIGWYDQRLSIETDKEVIAILSSAQKEEFKHFSMDLEWLLRQMPVWQKTAKGIIFQSGNIAANGEKAEEKAG